MWYRNRFVAHDGAEGLSPDGWLPDRISIGVLTRAFPPEAVDAAVDAAGVREQRRRLLPARLMVYFVLALWLFRGRNSGYGQVMAKLAGGLYHQRRGADLLAGRLDPAGWVDAGDGRRWKQPNISSLSRGRGKLGPDPVRAGRRADGSRRCPRCLLLRAARDLDRRVHHRRAGQRGERRVLRPAVEPVPGRRAPAGPVGSGGRVGDREP